ncbi:MAG: hypothetical protein Q8919_07155 [Bacteroidota bacterium]|nr:hypothetical protein [Bacteroidota bacterium]
MNTTENIVEAYYRFCKNAFTMQDIKVVNGNNRQFDLLAVSLKPKKVFHVESSVSLTDEKPLKHRYEDEAVESLNRKFFGALRVKNAKSTKSQSRSNYKTEIDNMYRTFGLHVDSIERVYCRWAFYQSNKKLEKYMKQMNISKLSFRDDVLPALEKYIKTAHYEDDALRTLSLLSAYRKQIQKKK